MPNSTDIVSFNSEGDKLENSLLIGNGKLGAIIHGGKASEFISLNIDSLWSRTSNLNHNRKGQYKIGEIEKLMLSEKEGDLKKAHKLTRRYLLGGSAGAYMPLADLVINHNTNDFSNFSRSLDMSQGLVATQYGDTTKEYFASYPDNVIVIKYSGRNLDLEIDLSTKHPKSKKNVDKGIFLSGHAPSFTSNIELAVFKKGLYCNKEDTIAYYCGLSVNSDGQIRYGKNIEVKNASFVEIRFVADTSYDNKNSSIDTIKNRLANSFKTDYNTLLANHCRDFSSLYNKCRLELCDCGDTSYADTEIEDFQKDDKSLSPVVKLFNFGRYLMISGSRKGSEALNLQGIWQDRLDPPWSSNYTTNINLEMNYWATEQVGLGECVAPLINQIIKMEKWGRVTAKETYNGEGWVSGHNSDIWGHSSPVCGFSFNDPCQCAQFFGCSGWLCLHLFEHYEYTCDKNYLLNTAFPIMKGAVEFYLGKLVLFEDKLILTPSSSPENRYLIGSNSYGLTNGATMDMSIVKQLFSDYIMACKILSVNDELLVRVKNSEKKIKPFTIGSKGQLLEWSREYAESDEKHRHISHLYANHPAHLINDNTKELQAAVKKSLELRGDEGTGWSIAWKINQYARLSDGEHAYKLIKMQLKPCLSFGKKIYRGGGTYPNYLCAHPPFQIDGNFGVMSGIAEMLMQSDTDCIKVLPAVPSRWRSGSVKGMVAKNNRIVDIEWNNDNVYVTVYSNSENIVSVTFNNKKHVIETNKKAVLK